MPRPRPSITYRLGSGANLHVKLHPKAAATPSWPVQSSLAAEKP